MSTLENLFRPEDDFSPETVAKRRKFPIGKTVLLAVLILVQIVTILFAILYTPKPDDVINDYRISVTPVDDGSLLIDYSIKWTPLTEEEPLTWIEIGMANYDYSIKSFGGSISTHSRYADGYGYVGHRFNLDREYCAGETVLIEFSVIQNGLLSRSDNGYYHRFIPCWFNSIEVEHYLFTWNIDGYSVISDSSNSRRDTLLSWEGALSRGEYISMEVEYSQDFFVGVNTTTDFDILPEDAYDELRSTKISVVTFCVFLIIVLLGVEIYILDCFVSYSRGRGFICGYGHHIHHYGMVNPLYISARNRHISSNRGGTRSGGGCACACACACAGGGRAGCSQKDGYRARRFSNNKEA